MIEFDVDMGYLLEDGKLDCVVLNDENGEHEPMRFIPERTCNYVPDIQGYAWWDEDDNEHDEEDSANEDCWSASCSECGYTMIVGDDGWFNGWDCLKEWVDKDGNEHKGYLLEPRFNYCPFCGAKVMD